MEPDLTPLNDERFRANRFDLVSRLADDLAHEIKNPLNSIVINLEVLRVRVTRGDTAAALERGEIIEKETRRLHLMIDRLLQLLRPERDEGSFALDRALDELMPLMDARVRLAGNTFTITCSDSALISVPRDTFKFAALNLLTAVHDRLGENGGTLLMACDITDARVSMDISAVRDPDSPPLPAVGEDGYDPFIDVAAALLEPAGGTVERYTDGVRAFLPRSGSQ